MSEFFLYYNYLPILAKHILDFPINRYPKGIKQELLEEFQKKISDW